MNHEGARAKRGVLPVLVLLFLLPGLFGSAGAARAEDQAKKVKPGIPFLMSAVLPGTGQLYLGHNHGLVYLGLDAAAWFAHFAFQQASFDKNGESEAFARRHWSLDRYAESESQPGCDQWYRQRLYEQIRQLQNSDPSSFYETLAREDSLRSGWDDSWDRTDTLTCGLASANWRRYRDLRSKSDDLHNTARIALVVAVVNRVVSSIDALRLAKRRATEASLHDNLRLESDLRGSWRNPRAEIRLVKTLP